jgi:hypothetical protein
VKYNARAIVAKTPMTAPNFAEPVILVQKPDIDFTVRLMGAVMAAMMVDGEQPQEQCSSSSLPFSLSLSLPLSLLSLSLPSSLPYPYGVGFGLPPYVGFDLLST